MRSATWVLLIALGQSVAACSLDFDRFHTKSDRDLDGGEGDGGHVGDMCSDEGSLACDGHASRQTLVCRDGRLARAERCASDERCDSRVGATLGMCLEVPAECEGRSAGAAYCVDEKLRECGPDLVSFEDKACGEFGACSQNSGGAECECEAGHTPDRDAVCNDQDAGSGGQGGRNGKGGDDDGPGNDPPTVTVDFPPTGTTDLSAITVRGHVRDPEGDAIAEVRVNGKRAQVDKHGAFSVRAPLKLGKHALSVHVEDEQGAAADVKTSSIERLGYMFEYVSDMVLDGAGDRVIALDSATDAVVAIALDGGARTVIAPVTDTPTQRTGLALDAANDRVLVAERTPGALVWIDLGTGERTLVSDGTDAGQGPAITPIAVALDPSMSTRAFVLSTSDTNDREDVYRVDLENGQRTLIAPSGTALDRANDLVYDAGGNRLIVAENLGGLMAVDVATGMHTVITRSGSFLPATGGGVAMSGAARVELDGERALVCGMDSDGYSAIFGVDLATGVRVELAALNFGDDPKPRQPSAFNACALDLDHDRGLLLDTTGLLLATRLEGGHRQGFSTVLYGAGPSFRDPVSIAQDTSKSTPRWIVADQGLNAVFAVDPKTGDRSVISDNADNDGPDFSQLVAVDVDGSNGNIIVLADTTLYSVDPVSGERTVLSSGTVGSGPSFARSRDVVVDGANALVVGCYGGSSCESQVIAIPLSVGGVRTLYSTQTGNTGPSPSGSDEYRGIAYFDNGHVVISDTAMVMVDSSGDRTVVSDADRGDGPDFESLRAIYVEWRTGRAIVVGSHTVGARDEAVVWAVDLATGDRTLLSSADTGDGPFFNFVQDVAVDDDSQLLLMVIWGSGKDAGLLGQELADRTRDIVSDQGRGRWDVSALVLDHDSGLLYAGQTPGSPGVGAGVFSLEPHSGDVTTILDDVNAAGVTHWELPLALELDADDNRLLAVGGSQTPGSFAITAVLSAIDIGDGTQTILADANTGTGIEWNLPLDVVADAAHDRILLNDGSLLAILAVDSSGERTVFSGAPRGDGVALVRPAAMALDEPGKRLLVLDSQQVIEIDLTSGDRKVLSGTDVGDGPLPVTGSRLVVDAVGKRAIVLDLGDATTPPSLLSVALEDGTRALLMPLPRGWYHSDTLPPQTVFDGAAEVAYLTNVSGAFAVDITTGEHVLIGGCGR